MVWTLRRILTLIVLLSMIAVMGTLVWVGATYQRFAIETLNDTTAKMVTYEVKQRIEDLHVKKVVPTINRWSRLPSLVDSLTGGDADKTEIAVNQLFHTVEVISGSVRLRNVVVYDADMNVFARADKGLDESIATVEKIIKQLKSRNLAQQRHMAAYLWRTAAGRPVQSVIAPVGGFQAVGFVEFILDPLPDLVGIGGVFDGAFVLMDSANTVLFEDGGALVIGDGGPAGDANPNAKQARWETLQITIPDSNRGVWATASITRDVADFMNEAETLRNGAVVIVAIVFLSSVAMGWFLLRFAVFGMLKEFSNSMKMLAQGKAEVSIPKTGNDEFGIMRTSLDGLRTAVQMRYRLQKEAEAATVAKSKFLAAASHDLRQPLQAINLFVHALKQRDLDSQNRDIIEHIGNSVESLKELLNVLLDVSKLEAGVVSVEKRSVPIADLLDALAEEFEPLVEEKGLELRVVSSQAGIYSDPVLLKNILRNLLSNAIRYTKKGRILLGCRHQGHFVRIEVWDGGEGIGDDHVNSIFEEFYQIDNPARDRRQGLGLGLSIVRRTAELLDHELFVTSNLGKGSVFSVKVPSSFRSKPVEGRARSAAGELSASFLKDKHVVVIEDDVEVLGGLKMLLQSWGGDVTALPCIGANDSSRCERCQQCVPLFAPETTAPDFIVADYNLQTMTGVSAVHILEQHFMTKIPAILLTGNISPADLCVIEESGLSLLHKPIQGRELQESIAQMAASRPTV